jgi:hypothetical protein
MILRKDRQDIVKKMGLEVNGANDVFQLLWKNALGVASEFYMNMMVALFYSSILRLESRNFRTTNLHSYGLFYVFQAFTKKQ